MKTIVTKTISIIFNPLIIPTLGILVLLFTESYISLLPISVKRIILLVVLLNCFILPLLMITLFKRLGIVKSIHMDEHRERLLPMFLTLIPFAFTYFFVRQLPIPLIIPSFILGGTLVVVIAFIITFWWKISIHMISVGGIVGLIYILSFKLIVNTLPLLLISIIISGLVAWSRLSLGAHKPSQVYTGFLLGALIVVFAIMLG